MNLYLIGYRATGKSTLAPLLAEGLTRLGPVRYEARDTDQMVEASASHSIAEIFRTEGETGFRERESAALATVAKEDHRVVATGGGIVLSAKNRAILEQGFPIWLRAQQETILARLAADQVRTDHRPALTALPLAEEVARLLAERQPLYAAVARITVDTDNQPLESLADDLAERWLAYQENRGRC